MSENNHPESNDTFEYSSDGSYFLFKGIKYRRYADANVSISGCPANIQRTIQKLKKE